eukprot:GHVS01024489.1.p1 GENE.GHVS01024489.1~~GHVS01024489.1.p1  ORF type:complete len:490 (+),score=60.27 GHVS01024489.1:62-1531(+)
MCCYFHLCKQQTMMASSKIIPACCCRWTSFGGIASCLFLFMTLAANPAEGKMDFSLISPVSEDIDRFGKMFDLAVKRETSSSVGDSFVVEGEASMFGAPVLIAIGLLDKDIEKCIVEKNYDHSVLNYFRDMFAKKGMTGYDQTNIETVTFQPFMKVDFSNTKWSLMNPFDYMTVTLKDKEGREWFLGIYVDMRCRAEANGWSCVACFSDTNRIGKASAKFPMSKQRFSDLFAIIFSEEIRIKNSLVEEVKLPYIHFYFSAGEETCDHARYLTVNTYIQLRDGGIYPSVVFRLLSRYVLLGGVDATATVNPIYDDATAIYDDNIQRYKRSVKEGLYVPRVQLVEEMTKLISSIGGGDKDRMIRLLRLGNFLWWSTKDVNTLREKIVSMNEFLQLSPPVGLEQCLEYHTQLQGVKTFDSWKHLTILSNVVRAVWDGKVQDAVLDIGIALADLDAVRCQLQLTGHNRVTADELRGYHTTNKKCLGEETPICQ